MAIFGFGKKRLGRPHKKPKALSQILTDAFNREVNKDEKLKKELAFRQMGYADIAERDSEVEEHKKEIKKFITQEALKQIKEDPELASRFVESEIEGILSGGKPVRHRGYSGEIGGYVEGGSSLSTVLEEIDTIEELRERLGGGQGGGGGFFQGMTLKDLLSALPSLAALLGKGPIPENAEGMQPLTMRTYVVKIDGQQREVPEVEYRRLVAQKGKITPIVALAEPTKTVEDKKEEPPTKEDREAKLSESKLPPDFLGSMSNLIGMTSPEEVESYLDMEPIEFVGVLRSDAEEQEGAAMFLLGLLSNTTYEAIVENLTPYRSNEEWKAVIERIMSDAGKEWLQRVMVLIKEKQNE